MKRLAVSLLSGSLFGSGLLLSGMTDTAKVQGWLDILGHWDPTLAFVMVGAITPMIVAWLITAKKNPVFDMNFTMPSNKRIDLQLVAGSLLFGMGWALGGLCPGPSIAALGFGGSGVILFFFAMLLGMLSTKVLRLETVSLADG